MAGILPLLACALVIACAPDFAFACSASDVTVKQYRWDRETSDYVRISGEFINNCADSTGVQLQAVFRDKQGSIVATEEFWPASTKNIVANQSYRFSKRFLVPADASQMSLRVLDVHAW